MNEEEFYLSQIPKPEPTRLGATKVGSILNRVIQQKGYAAVQSTELLQDAWADAVGPQLRGQTRVGQVARGGLVVYVSNQVVQTEIEFQKAKILRTLQDRLPEFGIRRLTIRVGR